LINLRGVYISLLYSFIPATVEMQFDWGLIDDDSQSGSFLTENERDELLSFVPPPAVNAAMPEVAPSADAIQESGVVGEEGLDASPSSAAIPAIVLSSDKKASKRKRVEKKVEVKQARDIYAEDRQRLVAGLIQWFCDRGYVLRSHAAPFDDVEQLGYISASFLESKGTKVAVLCYEFPKPVGCFTVRIYDHAGRFPVVFVSSADCIVDQLKVKSVEHWEDNARRFLPQFDVDAEEVSTLFGTKRLRLT
jgi:hypothetical protein